jgi:outer membrane protein insertion porin family
VQERAEPDSPLYRDLLVEVKERNTGSINFGVATGSDSGVFGELSLRQDNFDVADWPESFQEYFTGRAFRGAGQRFSMVFRPGNEIFQYSMSLTEPHLFDTDYSLTGYASFRSRYYQQYDEDRVTGSLSLGRKLGDVWQLGVRTRIERVQLDDIDDDAPVDIFDAEGPDQLDAFGVTLTRTTVGTITRPGKGSRFELSLDRFGVLTGDYEFFNIEAGYTVFLTLDEDFLGRKSVLKLNTRVGYLFGGDAPTYERFYLGGRSFRGFDFRTVSPKGIRNDTGTLGDDPVGGEWLFFAGAQYEWPLFDETITGVVFLDSGTVSNDIGFEEYRVSVGVGVRLYIPQLGPVPIAFDFGFPLLEEEGDESQVLSFSAELPF